MVVTTEERHTRTTGATDLPARRPLDVDLPGTLGLAATFLAAYLVVLTIWRFVIELPVPPAVADPSDHWVTTVHVHDGITHLSILIAVGLAFGFFSWRHFRHRGLRVGSVPVTILATVLWFAGIGLVLVTVHDGTTSGSAPAFEFVPLHTVSGPLTSGSTFVKTEWLAPDHVPFAADTVDCWSSGCTAILVQGELERHPLLASLVSAHLHTRSIPITSTPRGLIEHCWSASDCLLAGPSPSSDLSGGFDMHTTDAGATWDVGSIAFPYIPITVTQPMSCGAPAWCVILSNGNIGSTATLLVTTDGGATWSSRVMTGGAGSPAALTCVSPTTCDVVLVGRNGPHETLHKTPQDDLVASTLDGGSTWTFHPMPTPLAVNFPTSVSCPTTTWCGVIGEPQGRSRNATDGLAMFISSNDGTTWARRPLPLAHPSGPPQIAQLMCNVPEQCLLSGNVFTATSTRFQADAALVGSKAHHPWIHITSDGGRSWVGASMPPQAATLSDVSCDGPRCAASIGAAEPATRVPHAQSSLPRVTAGTVMTSADGGRTWKLIVPPSLLGKPDFPHTGLG